MKIKTLLLFFVFISCNSPKPIQETTTNHFPTVEEKVKNLPDKDHFYIFLMAGQSNMAGRGFVQPADTIISDHVLVLNKNNEWVFAKEPLHYYEPTRTGLDCGLSFGKKLSALYGKNIMIGLVPCAVGGSSIEQWLGDSTYRNVTLYSNFLNKLHAATQYGNIKGLLWHQGEANASAAGYKNFKQNLVTFFEKVRKDVGNADMPVYVGQLSSFLNRTTNPNADAVNNDFTTLSTVLKNFYVINTSDLTPKSDTIHFDSPSQRMMGERFAMAVYKNEKNKNE
jgi:Carbohydrate esterase, sialic acid-specific acetylesterase